MPKDFSACSASSAFKRRISSQALKADTTTARAVAAASAIAVASPAKAAAIYKIPDGEAVLGIRVEHARLRGPPNRLQPPERRRTNISANASNDED